MREFSLAVPVDTATLLVVDPCHLPADLVEKLLTPSDRGFSVAALVPTMIGEDMRGDGWYSVEAFYVEGPDASEDYESELLEWQESTADVSARLADPAYLRRMADYLDKNRSRS